jgi:hypothetical protein
LLEFADEARTRRNEALAKGDCHLAAQWDEHERALLRAYEELPYPHADAPAVGDHPTMSRILSLPVGPNGQYVDFPYPSDPEEEPDALLRFFENLTGFLNRNFPKEEPQPLPNGGRRG